IGTSTLVAQAIGRQDPAAARRIGWHGLAMACALAVLMGGTLFSARHAVVGWYTGDSAVLAAAMPLLAFVALFHVAHAPRTVRAFVLRAWRIATLPLIVNATALWGVGLAGGYLLAFNVVGSVPRALQGARGFWVASTAGLVLTALALAALLLWLLRARS